MRSSVHALKCVRTAYRRRGEAATSTDILYTVYAAVLVAALLGFPALRALIILLTGPDVVSWLAASSTAKLIGTLCGGILACMVALGQMRGPVTVPPFFVTLLAGTDLPRRKTLLRPFLVSAAMVTSLFVIVSALPSFALAWAGITSWAAGTRFILAAGCFGVICSVAWLVGSCVKWKTAFLLLVAIASATVVPALLVPHTVLFPWHWVARAWPTASIAPWSVVLIATLATLAGCVVPYLLDQLRIRSLLEQARRAELFQTARAAGDMPQAFSTFRALPTFGRQWSAVRRSHPIAQFLLRDLIGALRTPVRFLGGSGTLILAALLLAITPNVGPSWLSSLLGSCLGYLALGAVSDGFRHAAQTVAAPRLYGYGPLRLFLLHALLPGILGVTAGGVGWALAHSLGLAPTTAWSVAVTLLLLVATRAYDSAKGQVPLTLLAPILTPLGDASGLAILVWQADALLLAATIGIVVIGASAHHALLALSLSAGAAVALSLLLVRRLGTL